MRTSVTEKLSNIEWLGQHMRAKTPNYEQVCSISNDDVAAWELRCATFENIETPLAKALASVYVWGHKAKVEYAFVQEHLANIMKREAEEKEQRPNNISLKKLAELVALLVLDFEIDPYLNEVFTSKGRLYYAGIAAYLTYDAYRKTWKNYEKLMEVALVNARWEIEKGVSEYRKMLKSYD
ncbi:hypothetical protein LDX65_05585 [Acinetobacter baumannii]|uniref:hypothetical protein n=1 Tax=Acinetobacter baumannii TaxID=470 RepID=UPI001CDB8664|nr:hypothetical protein [Acinetobacter baumannii]MCA4302740.1 hypothetical protein [Acinetobacter baumannii]